MKKGIISLLSVGAGAAAGAIATVQSSNKKQAKAWQMSDKHLALFKMMNQWVAVKQQGKNLAEYFEANGYKSIAIYGMSYAGESLVEELKDTGIEVKYGIDKNASNLYSAIDVYSMEDELESVDAVVVTPIFFFDEINEELNQKFDCPIVSLEDILYAV